MGVAIPTFRMAFALIPLMALSIAASGCRVGNNVESQPNPDKWSGYYELTPYRLNWCAAYNDPARPNVCRESAITALPSWVSVNLTQPVALIMLDLEGGIAALLEPNSGGKKGLFKVVVDTERLEIATVLTHGDPKVPWFYTACTQSEKIDLQGSIRPGVLSGTVKTELTLAGKLELLARVTDYFDGPCSASLREMGACYSDADQCMGGNPTNNLNNQAIIRKALGPWVESGAIPASDLSAFSSIRELSYEMEYR